MKKEEFNRMCTIIFAASAVVSALAAAVSALLEWSVK